jgi:hypothetical protein
MATRLPYAARLFGVRAARNFQQKVAAMRSLSTTAGCRDIFNVQDQEDFEKRVLGSDKPVIVDFHAE